MADEDELASEATDSGANDHADSQVDEEESDASESSVDALDGDNDEEVAQGTADNDKVPTDADAAKTPSSETNGLSAQDDNAIDSGAIEPTSSAASSGVDDGVADDARLVTGLVPSTKTFDRHVKDMISRGHACYLYFDQWTWTRNTSGRLGAVTQLRLAFEELLPRLIGARDYAGAAKVLGVVYNRFTVTPALCIEASLEILRRQPDYRNDLLSFYEAVLEVGSIDKLLILKEMWLLHIVHGEFYEAYHLYQDKIQHTDDAKMDERLLANFGILCYWLMFIESTELRELLRREDTGDDEEEDDDADANALDATESIESVIESNYLFKTPIGVHILYQDACTALRRAVALSPHSAMFVEYYVQLLVLVGDIQPACDYLEAFFHMNPDDPHGSRMLAGFLGCYYPDSVDAQVAVLSRWMKNDPSAQYPLEKMLELSSAGAVSSFVLTKMLVGALDTCGSDSYVAQNPEMALALWRNLAELLAAMDESEFLRDQVGGGQTHRETIQDVGAQRLWWKRFYFSRPSTVEEVAAVSKSDGALLEVAIYRAVVADRLFPGQLPLKDALRSAMTSSDLAFRRDHVRLFKSFFLSPPETIAETKIQTPFSSMPFIHVTVGMDEKRSHFPLPVFKGSADTLHVIARNSIVERESASEKVNVAVTRTGENEEVNPRFVEELYQALERDIDSSDKRPQRKRKAAAISSSETPLLVPAYIRMIEEQVYSDPGARVSHIYSVIYEKLRRSDLIVPTSKVVTALVGFFRNRLKKNVQEYGHVGLLMRYEEFIATYVHRQKVKGVLEVTKDAAKVAIEEMKRVLPSPHPFFPDEDIVEETMRIKAKMFIRQRRLRLMEINKAMKEVLKEVVYVDDEKTFADAVYSVCEQNGLSGIVSRVDIARTLQNILPAHYYDVLRNIRPTAIRLLTVPVFREDCKTPEEFYNKLQTRGSKRTLEEIKALWWVERYEALYGPIVDDEEDPVDISDSEDESSSLSSSSSPSSSSSSSSSDLSDSDSSENDSDSDPN